MITRITPTLSAMNDFGGSQEDKLGEAVAKIVDYQAEISSWIDSYINAKKMVSGTIDKIADDDQRRVLFKRYCQGETFEQISCDMNMTYRNICYIHGKALQAVDQILIEEMTKADDN